MATLQPALRDEPADHIHADGQTCPYCEQPIPNDRAEEIRERFEADARRQAAALKARMDEQLVATRAELDATKKAEIEKLQQDNAAALEKLKMEALARESAAREAAKKAAEAEALQKIELMAAEQEAAKIRVAEAEQQKAAAVAALETMKAQQEATIAERAAEVRTAMEKNKNEEISAINAKHTLDMAKISEQMTAMKRRIDAEEGEGADIKLFQDLKATFPKDEITSINKTSGADIIHVVKHNNKICGKIVYDSRNRNGWQAAFVTKLREDMVTEKADHAILTTSKFPAGARQIECVDGVIAANPARVLVLVGILRAEVVRNHGMRISEQDRSQKTVKLYDFIVSEGFDKLLGSVAGNDEKLLQLEVDEKTAHDKMWEKRGRLLKSSQKLHAKLREEVDCIIGTSETDAP